MGRPKGTPQPAEACEKISAALAGRKKTDEHKRRISEGRREAWRRQKKEEEMIHSDDGACSCGGSCEYCSEESEEEGS